MSRSLRAPGACNPSENPHFREILARRGFLKAGAGIAVAAALPGCATQGTHPVLGFTPITASNNSGERKNTDPGNPRAPNPFGHIVRWREEGDDVAATRFRWEVFALAGPEGKNTIKGDAFACPDGLWIDSMGTLWVQTDVSPTALGKGDFAPLGNNQALAVDPATGVFKRFLTGPRGCEITAFHTTPDNRTAFVNIQHRARGRATVPTRMIRAPARAGPTTCRTVDRAPRPW